MSHRILRMRFIIVWATLFASASLVRAQEEKAPGDGYLGSKASSVDVGGRAASLPTQVTINAVGGADGIFNLTTETTLDHLNDIIQMDYEDAQIYNDCGARAYYRPSDVTLSGSKIHFVGNISLENWYCIKASVPEFHGFTAKFRDKIVGKALVDSSTIKVDISYDAYFDKQLGKVTVRPEVNYGKLPSDGGGAQAAVGLLAGLQKKATEGAGALEGAIRVDLPADVGKKIPGDESIQLETGSNGAITAVFQGKISATQESLSKWLTNERGN